jgi:hypothetical protein
VDAHAHLVRLKVVAREEAHVVGRDHRHALGGGEGHRGLQVVLLVLAPGPHQLEVIAITEGGQPAVERAFRLVSVACHQQPADVALAPAGQRDQARVGLSEPVRLEQGPSDVLVLAIAAGDEPREVAVAALVLDENDQLVRLRRVRRVAHPDVDADQRLHPLGDRGLVEPHHGEQGGTIGDRQGAHARPCRRPDQGLDVGEAIRERILGVDVEMDEARLHGADGL